jgi:hypothetical protein
MSRNHLQQTLPGTSRNHKGSGNSDPANYRNDQDLHRPEADIRHCDNREHRSGDDGFSDRGNVKSDPRFGIPSMRPESPALATMAGG